MLPDTSMPGFVVEWDLKENYVDTDSFFLIAQPDSGLILHQKSCLNSVAYT